MTKTQISFISHAYSFRHLVLSHFGLACVIMLRLVSPELVMLRDFKFRTYPVTSTMLE